MTVSSRRAAAWQFQGSFRPCLDALENRAPMSGFTDDFEGSSLNPYWSSSVSSGSIIFPSTERAHGGNQSVQFSSTNTSQSRKGIQIRHDFASPTYGTASVWMFDTGAGVNSTIG